MISVLTKLSKTALSSILCCSLYLLISTAHCQTPIQSKIQSSIEKASSKLKIGAHTRKIYQENDFHPLWMENGDWTPCAKEAIRRLLHAEEDGLAPYDYLGQTQSALKSKEGNDLEKADIELTSIFLQYIDDIRNGRFNPRLADKQLVVKPDPVDVVGILYDGIQSSSCDWIDELGPHYQAYQDLKKLLKHYRKMDTLAPWPPIESDESLEHGQRSPAVFNLREILTRLGDLKSEAEPSDLFDAELLTAVYYFQERHGLKVDGRIGKETKEALNTSPQKRIQQIEIAMERWRWMPRDPGQRYVRVNIAAFQLEAVENDKVALTSDVIIGMTYRETPVFSVNIQAIRFNPSWHIPRGIFVHDKLPKILKDSSYIRKRGYIVVDRSGRRVNPSSVNWSAARSKGFGYRLRQPPGSKNALGKLRFTMPNRFNVYLHDTSKKELFKKHVRTISSGCIRVQKPVELAVFVFNDPKHWNRSTVESEMQGRKTRNVSLTNKVPVHITYFTVWVDEDNRPHFVPDIYGQDKQVWTILKRSRKST